jgi:hypothetical protein
MAPPRRFQGLQGAVGTATPPASASAASRARRFQIVSCFSPSPSSSATCSWLHRSFASSSGRHSPWFARTERFAVEDHENKAAPHGRRFVSLINDVASGRAHRGIVLERFTNGVGVALESIETFDLLTRLAFGTARLALVVDARCGGVAVERCSARFADGRTGFAGRRPVAIAIGTGVDAELIDAPQRCRGAWDARLSDVDHLNGCAGPVVAKQTGEERVAGIFARRTKLEDRFNDSAADVVVAAQTGGTFEVWAGIAYTRVRDGRLDLAVDLRREGGGFVLSVRDRGRGLPEALAIERSTSLGFKLVHSLAKQVRASLAVEREGGTCVRLTMPDTTHGSAAPPR